MRRSAPLRLLVAASYLALVVALSAVGGAGAYRIGHSGPSPTASRDPSDLWAIPPFETAAILLAAVLYGIAMHRARGEVAAWRRVCFAAGLLVLAAALCSPLGGIAQQGLLVAHMLQHTLVGAVAPLLLLLGLPRGYVEPRIGPLLRRVATVLENPVLAFPLWAVGTSAWLIPGVHHEVLDNGPLWVLQQASFLFLGLVLWAPILEPVPAPRWFGTGWKGGYMTGVFMVGLITANIFWFSGTAFYPSHAGAAEAWGVQPLEDQANAGTVMMVVHCLLALGASAVLFFRQAREGDLSQRLIEAGLDRETVELATRAGTATALAEAHGIRSRSRPGID
ncbi:MAG: cytochrome c oxidase assembly protein [Thermoleophilia bacterium]